MPRASKRAQRPVMSRRQRGRQQRDGVDSQAVTRNYPRFEGGDIRCHKLRNACYRNGILEASNKIRNSFLISRADGTVVSSQ
jgi:hypothetical protein